MRNTIHRMCYGKRRYKSREQANKALYKPMAVPIEELRVYECPICRGYHLTKQSIAAWLALTDKGGAHV